MKYTLFLSLLLGLFGNVLMAQIDIDLPNLDVCLGETVTLDPAISGGTSPYTYAWTGNGLSCTDCLTPNVSTDVLGVGSHDFILDVTDDMGLMEQAIVTISVYQVEAVAIGFETSCSGEADGRIELTVSGGFGSYIFLWTGPNGFTSSVMNPIGLIGGTYTVEITDDIGCTEILSVTVSDPSPLDATGFITPITCNGFSDGFIDAIVSGGTPPYSYNWSNGANTEDIENLSAGTYNLTVTDFNGCQVIRTATIDEPDPLIVTITGDEIFCEGFDGIATANVSGGAAGYSYAWSTGETTAIISSLQAGTYCVTVVDANGCFQEGCVEITELPTFSVDLSISGNPTCENQALTYTAIPDGGSPAFSYLWQINGNTVSTESSIELFPGQLAVLEVVDANGCAQIVDVLADNPTATPNLPTSTFLSCLQATTTLDGSIVNPSPNISYSWSFNDVEFANTAIVTIDQPGIYRLVITDETITDCETIREVEVLDFTEAVQFEIEEITTACNEYQLSIPPANPPSFIYTWTLPDGSTSMDAVIVPNQTGVYQLQLLDTQTGCTSTVATFIDLEAEVCARINGQVIQDLSEDCLEDTGEPGLGNWVVQATSSTTTYFGLTDANGNYQLDLPLDSYTLSLLTPNSAWNVCLNDISVVLSNEGQVENQNFLVQQQVNCPVLNVDISTNFLRRCFNSFYYVKVCNEGTETAINPEVTVTLDDFLIFTNAALPTTVDGQELTFNLPSLEPGDCNTFWIQVAISCDAVLGQTHCTTAEAKADPLCVPADPSWSGASLEVEGSCNDGEVSFTISNTGMGDLDEPVSYIVIEDGVMLMEIPTEILNLPAQSDTIITLPANGSTYTIIVEQAGEHPFSSSMINFVEGCTIDGNDDFSTGFANTLGSSFSTPSIDQDCSQNIGAYDPNDKLAIPSGYGEENYIFADQAIDYRIRFQNTGTDTAFTVIIRDTLSPWLDINTLELGASSHDYRAEFQDDRTLVFTFDNIMLPDSNVNLEGSNGFVDYQIKPVRNIPLETRIENGAAIYFDFNEPVLTPVIFHTIGEDFLEVVNSVNQVLIPDLGLSIFPNPSPGPVQLQLEEAPEGERQLIWYDVFGRQIGEQHFWGDYINLEIPAQQSAWYFFQLRIDGQLAARGKVLFSDN